MWSEEIDLLLLNWNGGRSTGSAAESPSAVAGTVAGVAAKHTMPDFIQASFFGWRIQLVAALAPSAARLRSRVQI